VSAAPAAAPYLRLAPPYQPPYDDEAPAAGLRLVTTGTQELPFHVVSEQPVATVAAFPLRRRLPDPAPWARAFIQAALETRSGRRPASQLRGMATPAVLAGLSRAGAQAAAAGSQPVVVVRSVRVDEPADAVAEVCAVISAPEREGPRFRAVAARLEGHQGRWCCVTLQVG